MVPTLMPTSTFANAVGAAMEVPITKAAVARILFNFIFVLPMQQNANRFPNVNA
jgi:hypothetical protein